MHTPPRCLLSVFSFQYLKWILQYNPQSIILYAYFVYVWMCNHKDFEDWYDLTNKARIIE